MRDYNPFSGQGQWYKGNLHAHSTCSDGMYTPEELKDIYMRHGYSFLALSDHLVFNYHRDLCEDNFLFYPAMEGKTQPGEPNPACNSYRLFHMQVLQAPWLPSENPFADGERQVPPRAESREEYYRISQKYVDDMRARGNLVTLNHPIWSRLTWEDLMALDGTFAMEIFNSEVAVDGMDTGCGVALWDLMLRAGKRIWGIATDDCHNKIKVGPEHKLRVKITEQHPRFASCKGWVNVWAEELTVKSIGKALEAGRFYSSTGPDITHFEVREGEVILECSPAKKIEFITYPCRGHAVSDPLGADLVCANWLLPAGASYVRAQVIGADGKVAWTNPIFLD
ncbi:MAG: hypothetical protein LUF34_06520 [Lachnospiraceae bacterium]|nr:hypothetical protein [Lachnospiraceae bacterium]